MQLNKTKDNYWKIDRICYWKKRKKVNIIMKIKKKKFNKIEENVL